MGEGKNLPDSGAEEIRDKKKEAGAGCGLFDERKTG